MTAILAIDTATGPCSVAIWHNGRVSAYVENRAPVMQSASLVPMVEEALKQAGLGYRDLATVACTTGPGSFTGIRVGLATASGIAFASSIKGIGFTTLEVMAFAARKHAAPAQAVLALLNAGKGEYYYQCFPGGEPRLAALEQALADAGAGALIASNVPSIANCDVTFPRADALAELAATSHASAALAPFYIRPPDAKLPAGKC